LSLLALCDCDKPGPKGDRPVAQDERAKLAAHKLNEMVGPIWPHDSACYIWVDAQVAAGRLPNDDAVSGKAWVHCVDTSELEARKHPPTVERRATMVARRARGLPALPSVENEKKD